MADEHYPLDITFACSLGLEGGLRRYRAISPQTLPQMPADLPEFIKEWNRALVATMRRPEYKKFLGLYGRAMLTLRNPKLCSKLIDTFSVPYRSWYYAKRFCCAYLYTEDKIGANTVTNVFDYGRGLSPFIPYLLYKYPKIHAYTFDNELTNEIFGETVNLAGLKMPEFYFNINNANKANDVYTSLGTYVYMPRVRQAAHLCDVTDKFHNIFIELEFTDQKTPVQADAQLVKSMGAEYNPAWTRQELKNLLAGQRGLEIRRLYQPSIMGELYALSHLSDKLTHTIVNASEVFLQR